MDRDTLVKYWMDTAERDLETVEHLFDSGDYHWALFIGHLVVEKLFKALYVQNIGGMPPRIHDLARLAGRCGLEPDEAMLDKLDMISRFNLSVRYPDYQQEIYRMCTRSFSLEALDSIKEMRTWLLALINPS